MTRSDSGSVFNSTTDVLWFLSPLWSIVAIVRKGRQALEDVDSQSGRPVSRVSADWFPITSFVHCANAHAAREFFIPFAYQFAYQRPETTLGHRVWRDSAMSPPWSLFLQSSNVAMRHVARRSALILAEEALATAPSPLAAYNQLQLRLMRRYIARGGTEELWCRMLAPVFSARYSWMLPNGSESCSPGRSPTVSAKGARRCR